MDEYHSLVEAGLRGSPPSPALVLSQTLPTKAAKWAYEVELVRHFIVEHKVPAQVLVNAGFPDGHKGIRKALRQLGAQS